MTKLNRVTGKVFGGDATATGDNPEIGQFGSALAGTYNGTTDVATIQNLPAWGQGWAGAVTPDTNFPALPEMTGFGKVLSYQNNYLLQNGMAEWDSGTIYYTNQFCRVGNIFYYSLTDENQGNDPTTDTTNWAAYNDNFMPSNATTNRVVKFTGFNFGTVTAVGDSYKNIPYTLKAGTTLIIPNGRNSDGTMNNIVYTLKEDVNDSQNFAIDNFKTYYLFLQYDPDTTKTHIFAIQVIETVYHNDVNELPTALADTGGTICYVRETNMWYYSAGNSTNVTWTPINCTRFGYFRVPTAVTDITTYTYFYPDEYLTWKNADEIANACMPSPKCVDYAWVTSGTAVEAPGSGYFVAEAQQSNTRAYLWLSNRTSGSLGCPNLNPQGNGTLASWVPCARKDLVSVNYGGLASVSRFRFVYTIWAG